MKKLLLLQILLLIFSLSVFAQQLNLPRESQRQEISQTVGDAKVSIVYHRPSVKARKVWGGLVPFGQVWRTGANENTTFESSRDLMINGQKLPAGKYGFHAIPNENEWIIIFSKDNDKWGSFSYNEKQDALRVKVKPENQSFQETLSYNFENVTPNTAQIVVAWEKLRVPFTVDVGDVSARTLTQIREVMKNLKADDFRSPREAANWILAMKWNLNYEEALGWLDAGLKNRETYGLLLTKVNLLAAMNRKAEAIQTAEKAIQVGKAATPPANTTDLEKMLAEWKTKK